MKAGSDPQDPGIGGPDTLAPQITQLKLDLKKARQGVGIYIIAIALIMPKATWSIWAASASPYENRTPRPICGTLFELRLARGRQRAKTSTLAFKPNSTRGPVRSGATGNMRRCRAWATVTRQQNAAAGRMRARRRTPFILGVER